MITQSSDSLRASKGFRYVSIPSSILLGTIQDYNYLQDPVGVSEFCGGVRNSTTESLRLSGSEPRLLAPSFTALLLDYQTHRRFARPFSLGCPAPVQQSLDLSNLSDLSSPRNLSSNLLVEIRLQDDDQDDRFDVWILICHYAAALECELPIEVVG